MESIFNKKTFFEYISSADMELIHSQMISWLLSRDFQGFNNRDKSRTKILEHFFDIVEPCNVSHVATEQSSIDILVDLDHTILCIENKIKSSQHSDQLKKYQKYVMDNFKGKNHKFFFLTLIEEPAQSDLWVNKSYRQLLHILKELEKDGDIALNFNGDLLREYMLTLEKLLSAINAFISAPDSCPNVFTDGGIKKQVKASLENTNSELQRFIRANQLETFFQKLYFREVTKYIEAGKHIYLTETKGKAILGCFLVGNKEIAKGKQFNFGMDFQNGTFKTMCVSSKYEKSTKKDMPSQIIELFEDIHRSFPQYGYLKNANKPKTRAQCSVTKPLDIQKARGVLNLTVDYWWELTPEQFAVLFNKEIETSKTLIDNHILKSL